MHPELTASGGRRLTYLRLSVTDLCNLRCRYCMPPEGVPKLGHTEILTYEELLRLARLGRSLGMRKLRLTGGEPLVRRGLTDFIRRLKDEALFEDLRLTTNGVLLPRLAGELWAAGLRSLNLSLDALDPDVYAGMVGRPGPAGRDLFRQARDGFRLALDTGFILKINCVPLRGVNDDQLVPLARLVLDHPVDVRFIEHMPVGGEGLWNRAGFWPADELLAFLSRELGPLTPLVPTDPSAPARLYRPAGARGALGVISPLSGHFCGRCNRLRLTADGRLKPCLLTDREIDLRGPLRAGAGDEELTALFLLAAGQKPASHFEGQAEEASHEARRGMSRIGG